MAMNKPAAYGLYPHGVAPHEIIRTLNQAGFGNEDICMMLSPAHPIAAVVRDASILNGEREAIAATAILIGWLSQFGAVVIPTVGVFIRSQAFFHALMGARDGWSECWSTCPARKAPKQVGPSNYCSAWEQTKPRPWPRPWKAHSERKPRPKFLGQSPRREISHNHAHGRRDYPAATQLAPISWARYPS